MCGRYQFDDKVDIEEVCRILEDVNKNYRREEYKTGEIFPTNSAPVLALSEGKAALSVMKWGFPKWDGKGVVFNARSETAHEKKMFAGSLLTRRCVIPSTGFFEWEKDGKSTGDKYLFHMPNSPMLYMAGIYSLFAEEEQIRSAYVILTRKANDSIADIHDRMPVILSREELSSWLKDGQATRMFIAREDVKLVRERV